MKTEIISQLHNSFELAVNETDGVEYWKKYPYQH